MNRTVTLLLAVALLVTGCSAPAPQEEEERLEWAIAIHAGAGVIDREKYEDRKQPYLDSLAEAVDLGRTVLESGGTSLEAVERVVIFLEDDPKFNAGKGAVYTLEGRHELDAAIMNGADLSCGAVTAVTTVKNPIVLARLVMERTPHVLLAAEGAESFADESGVERVPNEYYDTEARRKQWLRYLEENAVPEDDGSAHGTVGVVALDRHGNLAAGTSTGGLTGKRFGRVGDTPIVGAGTYANNATCGVSGTGTGEEFIRHGVAQRVSDLMEYGGLPLDEAARRVVHEILKPGQGGVIAMDRSGNIALVFNTGGMFRGAADSTGRREVAIWD